MTGGKIENRLERGFVKHRLNYILITVQNYFKIWYQLWQSISVVTEAWTQGHQW